MKAYRRWAGWFPFLIVGCVVFVMMAGCSSEADEDQVFMATIQAYQATQISALETENAHQWELISHLSTLVPRTSAPVEVKAPTHTPTPWLEGQTKTPAANVITAIPVPLVQGEVVLEEGRCCAGGTAGTLIQIEAEFEASSPAGEVTEMRVLAGGSQVAQEGEIEKADWGPFEPVQTFEFTLRDNWIGFYVSVQFRDVQGNLSPVYWDDISVEGMPPIHTPTPGG